MARVELSFIRAGVMAIIGAFLLASCGVPGVTVLTKGDLAFDTARIVKKKRVAVETGGMPDFRGRVPTTGIMAGGMAGQIAAGKIGNEIVANNGVANPSQQVGEAIRSALSERHGMHAAPSRLAADLVIEVSTFDWAVAKYAQEPSRYYIVFSAIARMKDPKSDEVLGQTSCKNIVTDTKAEAAPTYEEMMANGAARLKAEMLEVTGKCADVILTKSLV